MRKKKNKNRSNQKSKKKNIRNPANWDKMSFEKREKVRAELKKERVYTKSFSTKQKFGPASDVIILDKESYLQQHPELLEAIK